MRNKKSIQTFTSNRWTWTISKKVMMAILKTLSLKYQPRKKKSNLSLTWNKEFTSMSLKFSMKLCRVVARRMAVKLFWKGQTHTDRLVLLKIMFGLEILRSIIRLSVYPSILTLNSTSHLCLVKRQVYLWRVVKEIAKLVYLSLATSSIYAGKLSLRKLNRLIYGGMKKTLSYVQ